MAQCTTNVETVSRFGVKYEKGILWALSEDEAYYAAVGLARAYGYADVISQEVTEIIRFGEYNVCTRITRPSTKRSNAMPVLS